MNKIKIFTRNNFREIPQVKQFLSEEEKVAIENVSRVLPFRVNNYVVNELINWENIPNDPLYLLTFPQKEMLKEHHYILIAEFVKMGNSDNKIKEFINSIRYELNPHPAGQLEENIPTIGGLEMQGVQHKYDQTLLFFPFHGQTCHSYCTFCF